MSAVVVFIIFVICLVIAISVSISLGIVSVLPGAFDPSFTASGRFVIRSMLGGIDSFPLLAVPMFVLSGIVMAKGGISKKLFDVFAFFLGKLTAGIPCAVIVTCLFYGAISGSAPATVAAVGSMTIPILAKLGYDKEFSTAVVAVSGGLGVIIPPSIPFIMYGMASGASVSDLFVSGIIPGLLIGGLLMMYAVYYCKKNGEDKEKIHAVVGELHEKGLPAVLKDSFFALLSPVIILGCIYSGIASPTEAAVCVAAGNRKPRGYGHADLCGKICRGGQPVKRRQNENPGISQQYPGRGQRAAGNMQGRRYSFCCTEYGASDDFFAGCCYF